MPVRNTHLMQWKMNYMCRIRITRNERAAASGQPMRTALLSSVRAVEIQASKEDGAVETMLFAVSANITLASGSRNPSRIKPESTARQAHFRRFSLSAQRVVSSHHVAPTSPTGWQCASYEQTLFRTAVRLKPFLSKEPEP